jgi:glycosyltransferase involved in cell wall biosynthesis
MFLITSDYEGIANAMLEAMAVGLPVVSTDSSPGGARMVITDHVDGLLAPVGDCEKITVAMCEYAANPELAQTCGNNAKNVIRRFDPQVIIDAWEEYCVCLSEGKKKCQN